MEYPSQLPYYADPATLPAALPTEAQVRNSKDILSDCIGVKVVRVGQHFVVKYGGILDEIEAQNMIFVRKKTKIPVPKVYAIFRSADKTKLFIVMEHIRGSTLLSTWPALSDPQKVLVLTKLRSYMSQLRSIPSPGYYGSIGKRHMPDTLFWTGAGANRNSAINGPFDREEDLNEALVKKSMLIDSDNGRPPHKGEFYRRSLPAIFHGHKPVFTHGDFQRKNILVHKSSSLSASAGAVTATSNGNPPPKDLEVTILDWGTSGWYPTYWEYCLASLSFRFDDDWPRRVEDVLKPYRAEYAWMQILSNDLWS
jgi:serine/threonine protein kinase